MSVNCMYFIVFISFFNLAFVYFIDPFSPIDFCFNLIDEYQTDERINNEFNISGGKINFN